MTEFRPTRREVIAAATVPALGALAGCGTGLTDDGTPTPRSYDHLRDERVFVADVLALSVPGEVETVDAPDDADVVVLPATTERSPEAAVDWIEAGKRVALVGTRSEDTWLDWQDSDAYAEAYPDHRSRARSCANSGSGSGGDAGTDTDCEPPELLVGWDPAEGPPTTYRKTWGGTDDPSDEQVFGGIDDAFDDEEW